MLPAIAFAAQLDSSKTESNSNERKTPDELLSLRHTIQISDLSELKAIRNNYSSASVPLQQPEQDTLDQLFQPHLFNPDQQWLVKQMFEIALHWQGGRYGSAASISDRILGEAAPEKLSPAIISAVRNIRDGVADMRDPDKRIDPLVQQAVTRVTIPSLAKMMSAPAAN